MSEEFAFKEGIWNSTAVNGDEREMGAIAFGMDRLCDQLLPSARFSNEQDRRVALRNLWNEVKDFLHGRRLADNIIEASDFVQASFYIFILRDQFPLMRYFFQNKGELFRFEGFEQVIRCPHFHGLHGRLNGAVRGNNDNDRFRVFLFDFPKQFDTIHPGHLYIHKQDLKRKLLQLFQGL